MLLCHAQYSLECLVQPTRAPDNPKLPLRSTMHHIVITYAAVAQQIAPSLLRILACCLSKQQCKATAYLFLELIKVQLQWSFLLCDLLQYPNQQKLLIHLL